MLIPETGPLRLIADAYTIRHVPRISFARIFLTLFLLETAIVLFSGAANPQTSASTVIKIGTMHVEGAHVISAERVIAATGLKPGDRFDPDRLNVVMQKLGKSGAFADLTYTYLPQGAVVKIDFKVDEARFRKCLFDNFIWLTKDEIDSRLQKDLPLYVGVAPETGDLLDDISAVLEKISQEKGIKVHVSRRVQQEFIGDKDWSHAYVAEGAKVEVKAVHFGGNLTVNPNELQKEATLLLGREYSAFGTDLFGSTTITSFFADRGYLRAKVGPSVVRILEHTEGSADFSVEVTYPITEGSLYRWQPAEWSGDQSIPSRDLDALTGMKPNDVANAKRIAEGWDAIRDAFAQKGYLSAKLSPEPVLDDANLLVHYRVALAPGPQYHMGSFVLIGLPPKIEEHLRSRWKLKAGDVFDVAYAKDFVRKEFVPILQSGGILGRKISSQMKPNHELHMVEFTLKVE